MGSLFLLQGIFPTQELNRCLLHCRRILYQLSYQGSPEPPGQPLIKGPFTLVSFQTGLFLWAFPTLSVGDPQLLHSLSILLHIL